MHSSEWLQNMPKVYWSVDLQRENNEGFDYWDEIITRVDKKEDLKKIISSYIGCTLRVHAHEVTTEIIEVPEPQNVSFH